MDAWESIVYTFLRTEALKHSIALQIVNLWQCTVLRDGASAKAYIYKFQTACWLYAVAADDAAVYPLTISF